MQKKARLSLASLWLLATPALAADLPELVRAALQNHPSMASQQHLGEAAEAGIAAARWQFFPTPAISMQHARTSDPAWRGDDLQTTASLQQPLWTGGRLTGSLAQAEAREQLAEAEREIARQQLCLRVVQAWSDAIAAQLKYRAWEQSRDTHQRLLDLVNRRASDGVSAQSDAELARQRLDSVEADWMTARAQRDSALARLNLLTGLATLSAQDLPEHVTSATADPQRPLASWLKAAHDVSPQLARARSQSAIIETEIRLARASLSPEVFVRAERQWGDLSLPNADPQNRILIGVNSAFGAGLSSLSGVSAARARHAAAQASLNSEKLAVDEQIRTDLTLAQSSELREQSLQRARTSANEIASSWERQFLAGRKQWVDLMNAARDQAQIDVQLADTLGAQQLTGWRLRILSAGVDSVLGTAPSAPSNSPLSSSPLSSSQPSNAPTATPGTTPSSGT